MAPQVHREHREEVRHSPHRDTSLTLRTPSSRSLLKTKKKKQKEKKKIMNPQRSGESS